MKRSEWAKLAAVLQARWPNREIPPESIEIYFEDLAEFPARQVNAAITALYRDGREWAPNGAQIRQKVIELGVSLLDHGAAYELAMKAASTGGGADYGLDWLEERDPVVAQAAGHYGWRDFCLGDTPDSVRRAQFREIYQQTAERAERQERYRGIEPAGLHALEAANDQPRRFGQLVEVTKPAGELEEAV